MKTAIFAISLSLAGCAAITPDSTRFELEHVSHATQHAPFTSHPTNYGYDEAQVVAHWHVPHSGAYMEIGEGFVLEPCKNNQCGGLSGPREVFTGRVGYVFQFKGN